MSNPVFLYAGLCGLLLLYLSVRVVQGRVAFKVNIGDGGNEEMQRRIRAQGNFIEYAPSVLILLYAVQQSGYSAWVVHLLGVVFVVARLLHASGLSSSTGISPGRLRGAGATFLVLGVASLLAVLGAFGVKF